MRGPFFLLAFCLLVSATAVARADDGDDTESSKPVAARPLRAGKPVEDSVATDLERDHVKRYEFTIPEDAVMARVELEGRADVDLYVARRPIDDYDARPEDGGPLEKSAESGTATEKVTLYRDGVLEPGRWYADVVYGRDAPPTRADGSEIPRVSFHLGLTVVRTRVDGKLVEGQPVAGEIAAADGGFRTYTIDVPEGAAALRFDLYGAPQDLNLRVRRGAPMTSTGDADKKAESLLGTEVILLKADDVKPGTWYVDVTDPNALDFSIPFKLRASFRAEPDPSLTTLPKLPAPASSLERALYSTVELVDEEGGGSGVLISDKGYILTNYHVVQDKVESHGMVGEPFSVALTIDPRDMPHELFRARVVTCSAELDLALLRVVSGFYGQPVPPDFRFPTAVLGAPERLAMGDPLVVIGYPAAGGTGSRASVTYTRGVVSGFERRGSTLHMKTDAQVNSGNSGGAALDDKLQLIGFPTEYTGDQNAHLQIAYIRPLWLVPADWWAKAGLAAPPKQKP